MQKKEKKEEAFPGECCPECDKKQSGGWNFWQNGLLVLALILSFFFLQKVDFAGKINFFNQEITFSLAFLTGVVASLSSCLAIVGSTVAAFSLKQKNEKKTFLNGSLLPNLFFHSGRLVAFFVLGGLLGFMGGQLKMEGNFFSLYLILISLLLAWLGLNILGLIPSISALGIRMPKGTLRIWQKLKNFDNPWSAVFLGALTFFLPCGFTQSVQLLALASGGFWSGGGLLFFFALGTLPVLLLFGTTVAWVKSKKWIFFQKAVGVLIIFSAFFTFSSGRALLQSKKAGNLSPLVESEERTVETVQAVEMKITSSGFRPNILKIKEGASVKWIINGDEVSGCTNKIIIPSLGIEKNILPGENVIEFRSTARKGEEIPFSCWMGMVRGKFIVE